MSHLFVYGTLMHPAILQAVGGLRGAAEVAWLSGYRRHPLRGECYPAIAAAPGGKVAGLLCRDVPVAAWRRLDAYEGRMYRRLPLRVTLADGAVVTAQCYLLRRRYVRHLVAGEWDYGRFVREDLARYQKVLRRG